MTWKEHTLKCTVQITTHNSAKLFGQFDRMVEFWFPNKVVVGSSPVKVAEASDIAPVLSKDFLDIKAKKKCGFTLKHVQDMVRIYSQMHRTEKN